MKRKNLAYYIDGLKHNGRHNIDILFKKGVVISYVNISKEHLNFFPIVEFILFT